MGDINYEPVIREMTWSYSRIKSFGDCPYKWYLKYIRRLEGEKQFFSSYGLFVHKLLERFYKGELVGSQLEDEYLLKFRDNVVGEAPSEQVFTNYFNMGYSYFQGFEPLPYKVIDVEKEVRFSVDGIPFVGYIDYLGSKNDELIILDNKSKILKPRTTKSKPTKTDRELDDYLRQLYLYSIPMEVDYGKQSKRLCFNCFRVKSIIEEPFNIDAFSKAKQWVVGEVNRIAKETEFNPNMDFFKCKYLCDMKKHCEYFEMNNGW